MQTAGGGFENLIFFVIVGVIVVVKWIAQRVGEQRDAAGGGSSQDAADEWKPPTRLPQPGHPAAPPPLPEFQPRREQAQPHREGPIAPPLPTRPHPVRLPPPAAVPPVLSKRGAVSPHIPAFSTMSAEEDEAAAPLRQAGETPGSLRTTHVEEWTRQDLPAFRTLEVPGTPPPNTVPDAPPPPYVPVPAAVAPAGRRVARGPAAPVSAGGRQRVPYRLTLNPRSMRQAVVLSEVLGRPRGYDL